MTTSTFTWRGRTWTLRKRAEEGPWYFTLNNQPRSLQTTDLEKAVQNARLRLEQRAKGGDAYTAFLATTAARATLTVGAVLKQWSDAGCPHSNGRPRTKEQQDRQKAALKHSLPWWTSQSVLTVTGPTLSEFAEWRRRQASAHRTGNAGDRAVDLELTTLSNAFSWAVARGHATKNPFTSRPRFQSPDAVSHCHEFMPASDEELHRITALLITAKEPRHQVAGAQLLFQALTGLRPGEPGLLRHNAGYEADRPGPGLRYQAAPDGTPIDFLAVTRLKGGINPAVVVRPPLASFLSAWLPHVRAQWPDTPWYFPDPTDPTRPLVDPEDKRKRLLDALNTATAALRLPERHPHAMRAFYVRVRRSQGADDARIAVELGQGSGPGIIVRTYGQAHGIHGDGRFDWQPASPVPAAWTQIGTAATNVTTLPGDKNAVSNDTPQDTLGNVPLSPVGSREENARIA